MAKEPTLGDTMATLAADVIGLYDLQSENHLIVNMPLFPGRRHIGRLVGHFNSCVSGTIVSVPQGYALLKVKNKDLPGLFELSGEKIGEMIGALKGDIIFSDRDGMPFIGVEFRHCC